MKNNLTRREFVRTTAAGSATLAWMGAGQAPTVFGARADKPALLGGTPAHQGGWPKWPEWRQSWEPEIIEVLRSGRWCRSGKGEQVPDFETAYADLLGAKRCVATTSGTTALVTALHVMGVDAAYHNCGRAFGTFKGSGQYFTQGLNFRMTHYQAALLRQQIDKLVTETKHRQENADRLTAGLKEIPGIQPACLPENSRATWFHYSFRYDASKFNGLPRNKFIKAFRAEGVPCRDGYHEQYFDGLLDEAINSRGFKRLFPAERLKAYRDSLQELPGNKLVCETNVQMYQTLLLAGRSDIDHIVEAVRKIQAHSKALSSV